jgi:peptidase M48-like protein
MFCASPSLCATEVGCIAHLRTLNAEMSSATGLGHGIWKPRGAGKIALPERAAHYAMLIILLEMLAYSQYLPTQVADSGLVDNPTLEGCRGGAPGPSGRCAVPEDISQPSLKLTLHPIPAPNAKVAVDHPLRVNRQEAERVLGRKLASKVEPHSNFITDPRITHYVNQLEQTLVNRSAVGGSYVVKVIDDVEINAFSLPGGFLYINGGLILAAENEAQLVAVLAHETAHVSARHMTKLENKRRLVRALFLVGGPAGYAMGRLCGGLFLLKIARDAEFEADRLALKYQYASGYDQSQFVQLLRNAFAEEEKVGFLGRLHDEHPSVETRVKRAQKTIARYVQPPVAYVIDTNDFHEIRKRVAAAMGVADADSSRAAAR